MKKYIPSEIEKKWQKVWKESGIYKFDKSKKETPYYTLVELPYPSGDLHLGHWFTFATADAHARYKKMTGMNVFYPPGYDAFGLPAENAAIKRNIHPQDWTMKNIETMTSQFETMGTMLDWSHEAITCLPEYYKWNQWIFIKMFEKGIAYRAKTLSNWCPIDQTVLANEHVENGKCWRCGSEVEQKEVEQWFLKITEYADDLIWKKEDGQGLSNGVDWPQSVKEGQNNWIGRSVGANIQFQISNSKYQIEVFTTRPDTLWGATFLVVAPEHPVVASLINSKFKIQNSELLNKVKEYVSAAQKKTEMERKEMKEKTGVFSGLYAINPVSKKEIPIWIADYVLAGYGTGAIMAVPAHDDRDFDFAKKFGLEITQVIEPYPSAEKWNVQEKPYIGEGRIINSGEAWEDYYVPAALPRILEDVEKFGIGKRTVQYHLHDWSVSRQRYWGTPVPVIYCVNCWNIKSQMSNVKYKYGIDYTEIEGKKHAMIPVSLEDLPVELPYDVDYTPKGKPPLATNEKWLKVKCPQCGKDAVRDAETLDTFFDSSWYYYRYMDPHFEKGPFKKEDAEKIMPLDIYFGGAEHTLGHTLYARFFTKFFKDIGLVDFDEFAKKRVQHGVILGPDGFRMSKSRGNVVNPDDVVKEYGTDTVRLYLCFMMPYDATSPWDPGAISGVYRFLRRVWELYEKCQMSNDQLPISNEDKAIMHKTIKKVGEDLEDIKFNTAVAALMEWLNHLSRKEKVSVEEYKTMILLLAPFAPHMAEELWQVLQNSELRIQNSKLESVHSQTWPKYDEKYLVEDAVTIVVQVNGKLRDNMVIQSSELKIQNVIEEKAKNLEKIKKYLDGQRIVKVIYIEGRVVNFVIASH